MKRWSGKLNLENDSPAEAPRFIRPRTASGFMLRLSPPSLGSRRMWQIRSRKPGISICRVSRQLRPVSSTCETKPPKPVMRAQRTGSRRPGTGRDVDLAAASRRRLRCRAPHRAVTHEVEPEGGMAWQQRVEEVHREVARDGAVAEPVLDVLGLRALRAPLVERHRGDEARDGEAHPCREEDGHPRPGTW